MKNKKKTDYSIHSRIFTYSGVIHGSATFKLRMKVK